MEQVAKKGIVIEIKDNDRDENAGNVTIFTADGFLYLLARGINKNESKNRPNLQIGALVELEYFPSSHDNIYLHRGLLVRATLIKEIKKDTLSDNIFVQKAIAFLSSFEKINQFEFKDFKSLFEAYVEILDYVGQGKNDELLTYLVAHSLQGFGIKPITNRCSAVGCNKNGDLCDFNFQGGYLCSRHATRILENRYLKAIYYMFINIQTFLQFCDFRINGLIKNGLLPYFKDNGIIITWEKLKFTK